MSRKKRPSNEEIVAAVKKAMAATGYFNVADYDRVRLGTQRILKTVPSTARAWIYEAITAPDQNELVLLHSSDSKFVGVVEYDEASDSYSHYGDLVEGKTLLLHLDYQGCRANSSADAVRNRTWVAYKSVVDSWIADLLKEESEKEAARARARAAENAETEEIFGRELSLLRGMLAAADIEIGDETLKAWGMRGEREGKKTRRGRATITLNAWQLCKLADWLGTRNVQPVTPEMPAETGES